jgi:hypothetical protein
MQPWIYAWLYGETVAVFPKAMFLLSAGLLYLAVCALLGVRPDVQFRPDDDEYQRAPTDEDAHMDTDVDEAGGEDDEDEDEDEVAVEEAEVRRRGRRSGRSMSASMNAEEIDEARHASLARMSFSEHT